MTSYTTTREGRKSPAAERIQRSDHSLSQTYAVKMISRRARISLPQAALIAELLGIMMEASRD